MVYKARKPIHSRTMIRLDLRSGVIQYYIQITWRSHTACSYKLMLCGHMPCACAYACLRVCAV